jgi:hypothetical protein
MAVGAGVGGGGWGVVWGRVQAAGARACVRAEKHEPRNTPENISPRNGTPANLRNPQRELYALLAALYPDVFTTTEPFDSAFDLAHGKARAPNASPPRPGGAPGAGAG